MDIGPAVSLPLGKIYAEQVALYAETSPSCVSITGNAVKVPPDLWPSFFNFAARSNKRE